MHISDGGRRPEQWHDPVLDHDPKGEHVVALVRLPCATRRQIYQAHDRGHPQEQWEGEPIQAVRHAGAVRALALPRS